MALCSSRQHLYYLTCVHVPSTVTTAFLPPSPSKMHHLSHSPALHAFYDHTGMLCIKGRYIYVLLLLCNSCMDMLLIAATAMGRTWLRSQLLLTPSLTVSPRRNFHSYLWRVNGINFIYQLLNLFTGFRGTGTKYLMVLISYLLLNSDHCNLERERFGSPLNVGSLIPIA